MKPVFIRKACDTLVNTDGRQCRPILSAISVGLRKVQRLEQCPKGKYPILRHPPICKLQYSGRKKSQPKKARSVHQFRQNSDLWQTRTDKHRARANTALAQHRETSSQKAVIWFNKVNQEDVWPNRHTTRRVKTLMKVLKDSRRNGRKIIMIDTGSWEPHWVKKTQLVVVEFLISDIYLIAISKPLFVVHLGTIVHNFRHLVNSQRRRQVKRLFCQST